MAGFIEINKPLKKPKKKKLGFCYFRKHVKWKDTIFCYFLCYEKVIHKSLSLFLSSKLSSILSCSGMASSSVRLYLYRFFLWYDLFEKMGSVLKFVFYRLFANSATRWDFLCTKIISNIAKSVKMFYDPFLNNGKLKIRYDFALYIHRKTHRVVEFAKSL